MTVLLLKFVSLDASIPHSIPSKSTPTTTLVNEKRNVGENPTKGKGVQIPTQGKNQTKPIPN